MYVYIYIFKKLGRPKIQEESGDTREVPTMSSPMGSLKQCSFDKLYGTCLSQGPMLIISIPKRGPKDIVLFISRSFWECHDPS